MKTAEIVDETVIDRKTCSRRSFKGLPELLCVPHLAGMTSPLRGVISIAEGFSEAMRVEASAPSPWVCSTAATQPCHEGQHHSWNGGSAEAVRAGSPGLERQGAAASRRSRGSKGVNSVRW